MVPPQEMSPGSIFSRRAALCPPALHPVAAGEGAAGKPVLPAASVIP